MDGEPAIKEGRREQKRRDTRLRIAEEGLRLFDRDGYDATTLEAVAAAAGVSARTLFHYFRTKYDVLEFWHDRGFEQALPGALFAQPAGQKPLPTVRDCLLRLVPRYETDRLVTIDRIRHSTDTLRADKQMVYFRDVLREARGGLAGARCPGGSRFGQVGPVAEQSSLPFPNREGCPGARRNHAPLLFGERGIDEQHQEVWGVHAASRMNRPCRPPSITHHSACQRTARHTVCKRLLHHGD